MLIIFIGINDWKLKVDFLCYSLDWVVVLVLVGVLGEAPVLQ